MVKLVRPDLEHDNAPLPRAGSKQDQDAKAKKAKEKTPAQKAEEEIAAAREAAGAEDLGAVVPKAAENKRLPKGTCKATNPELKKKGDATAQDHWNTWCDENCIPEKWGGIGENACKDGSMTGTVMCVCKQDPNQKVHLCLQNQTFTGMTTQKTRVRVARRVSALILRHSLVEHHSLRIQVSLCVPRHGFFSAYSLS